MESEGTLRHRTRFQNSSSGSFTKYGAGVEPPKDDAIFYPDDDTHSFFAQGRDFESAYVNHKYTEKERQTLGSFESLDYLPSHSIIYKHWIKRQPARLDWDRWVMMGLIGFAVGLVGFLLHQIIDVIADTKWEMAKEFIKDGQLLAAWGFVLGYSVLFVIISAGLVVFLRPSAGGSGLPELIGFLNGTVVRHIFNIKTMVVKFLSCCCAVGSGMPVGPEGPMIHLGSLVGAGLSQFKSDTLKINLPFFERFRNSEDRRNFISAGAAAGVASAFGAPVGGLLFSMEEVSSFWNQRLSWQIFFCAMVSTFTTDLFNSAFTGFKYSGDFGLFKAEKYILFKITKGISIHILTFIPATVLGVIGGALGSLFNFINLKIARLRRRMLSIIVAKWKQNLIRMAEPIIIMIVVSTISVFLPKAFGCTQYTCLVYGNVQSNCLKSAVNNTLFIDNGVSRYMCPVGISTPNSNYTETNGTYNQMATLLFNTGEGAIHQLFSRNTHLQFDYPVLFTVLTFYFFLACWSAGTSISSGLVVPMLFIGGCYGRIIGLTMVSMFGVHTEPDTVWSWMDPGAFALIGAASFFGGVSRLTMSLTVIMIEITNDVQFLLPIMLAIMVAKWVGDFVTHPIYHALLELKCIPFLDAEPVIRHDGQKMVNLELYAARDVMASHPITLTTCESVAKLSQLLLDVNHGGFPVVKPSSSSGNQTFHGFINRLELTVLLKAEDQFTSLEEARVFNPDIVPIEYQQMTLDKLSDPAGVQLMLQSYCDDIKYNDLYINLEPYVNQSAVSIADKFSLHRTYVVFRTLGLRHLTVVDGDNCVVGVITRKDLMGFSMEEKLSEVIQRNEASDSRTVELSDTVSIEA